MGPGSSLPLEEDRQDRPTARAVVNFTAGFGAEGFFGRRNVEGNGAEQAKLVRMTFADGFVLVDTVDNGIVLFLRASRHGFSGRCRNLDAKGSMLASYREFDQVPFVA